jgi:phosphopantothenoylcysteine decarboxylase/phosphopantothenate--cysteine ligase
VLEQVQSNKPNEVVWKPLQGAFFFDAGRRCGVSPKGWKTMGGTEKIPLLENRRILLGVTGSIAAYKSVDLASRLTQAGAEVDVILTPAAERFVSALSFQSVTGRRAYRDEDLWGNEAHVLHVGLAHGADLLIVAPATANTLAELAHGCADSLLTLTALGFHGLFLMAPAMDAGMFEHPATQTNLETLSERGGLVLGPAEGRMASGKMGMGRMLEPQQLLGHIRLALGKSGPLSGRMVVITAGGTQEPVDPVRVLANRSSGKQGFALAQAALDRGAAVHLIAGPVNLDTPIGAQRVDVQSTSEMQDSVLKATEQADALVMAAAVADFRPRRSEGEKIKRRGGFSEIPVEPTEDILAEVVARRAERDSPQVVIGFAAESEDLVKNAREKLERKGLSLIVANDITAPGSGFGADTNQVAILDEDGQVEELPLMSKAQVAEAVMSRLVRLLEG